MVEREKGNIDWAAMNKTNVRSFVNACLLDNAWSPDAFDFTAKQSFIPVFLYGTEKVGYSEDISITGPPRMGVGHTLGPPFLMYIHMQDRYPIVLSSPIHEQNARVYGHLFMVTPEELFELDSKYQNGAYFTRVPKWISHCPAEDRGKKDKNTVQSRAWMYVGRKSAWDSRITNREITLLPRVTPKGGNPFYLFGLDHEKSITRTTPL